jgi:putative ABC transport system permease protein
VIEGRENDWGDHIGPLAERTLVTPAYLKAMRIPMVAGRFIEAADASSDVAVAVINEQFARVAWPDENAVGKRFKLLPSGGWISVVGVVSDVYQWGLEGQTSPEYYIPFSRLQPYWEDWERHAEQLYVVTRSTLPPGTLVPAIRHQLTTIDADLALGNPLTMVEAVNSASRGRRFMTLLIVLFAATGLVLIATGIYAVVSTNTVQRTAEIGVRIALGADPKRVVMQVLTSGLRLVLTGVAFGLIGVAIVSGHLSKLLFRVHPFDPLALLFGTLTVVGIGLVATAMPAFRAARIDPVVALRSE